jgi:alkanesulfonate monooxygenase
MSGTLGSLRIFSTCPQSKDVSAPEYLQRVTQVASWSEEAGYTGILVYTDNGIVDPWPVAQAIVAGTHRLSPLIAVQAVYMHPYTAAKLVSSIAYLYGRRLWLNMVAGGFRNDLFALADATAHDDRYERLIEYALIVRRLLESPEPVTFEGQYYAVKNLRMTPPLPAELFPGLTSSGSSDAGMRAAAAIGAIAVRYPQGPHKEEGVPANATTPVGVRVGIVARQTAEEAWRIALERFPEDRKGQLTHELAMKVSDSAWHKQLAERRDAADARSTYWLGPFQNYKTFCPYLVGDYEEVARLLAGYIGAGFRTFILDIPPSREEIEHTAVVFEKALEQV